MKNAVAFALRASETADPVMEILNRMPTRERRRLLEGMKRLLREPRYCKNEALRVGAVRILVAYIEETIADVEKFLKDFSTRWSYELHFTLFCYLDLEDLPNSEALRSRVLRAVANYLTNARKDTARAAWMAGDLLGDHWQTEEAFEILCRIGTEGKHAAARDAAMHGLEEAMSWLPEKRRQEVVTLARRAAESDRSKWVRIAAESILEHAGIGETNQSRLPAR